MNKEIFEYVVERRKTVGIMLGTVKAGKIKIGWCKTALTLGDKFDKDFGMKLARNRAMRKAKIPKLPLCMKRGMIDFSTRCIRYFQDAKSMDLVR